MSSKKWLVLVATTLKLLVFPRIEVPVVVVAVAVAVVFVDKLASHSWFPFALSRQGQPPLTKAWMLAECTEAVLVGDVFAPFALEVYLFYSPPFFFDCLNFQFTLK